MPKKETRAAAASSSYRAEDITVLEGLDPVRKRPAMYIGTTGLDGVHHLLIEVFDNARDEAMAGHASDIEIVLLPGNHVRVVDNGRGIPVDKHKQTGVSALETVMTTLHAGGKFSNKSYKVSGGLHGVGVSVVNALSSWTRAEVHREGFAYEQEYVRGKRKAAVKKLGSSGHTGTIITFEPDTDVFREISFTWSKIIDHMRQQAYLVKGMRVTIIDAREERSVDDQKAFYLRDLGLEALSMTFYFEGGIVSLVEHENIHAKPIHRDVFSVERESEGVTVEVALQYVDDISARILSFANNTYNPEGGTHVTGFKTALTRTLNAYAKKNGLVKESSDGALSGDDVLEGLTAVISIKMPEIQFEGQTKAKLGSVEARSATEAVFGAAFTDFLEEHPADARAIIGKVLLALRARKAAKAAKDSVLRKGALEGTTLPGKLADCQVSDPSEAELFIVEGDSAGGSSKQGRDRRTQAILPLRGKILNVERARLDKMLASNEIKNLVIALGTAIGDTFDLSKLRYHKVIIATDADVDGAHIRTLLLTLFYRYFKSVIEGGFLYIAQPPLYKVKRGKEERYFYTEEEKSVWMKQNKLTTDDQQPTTEEVEDTENQKASEAKVARSSGVNIQRYKGLGEMNPGELWETTMDPARRVLKQVGIEDAREADRTFDVLMGLDVAARKSFIQSNAKAATLDV